MSVPGVLRRETASAPPRSGDGGDFSRMFQGIPPYGTEHLYGPCRFVSVENGA